MSMVNCSHYLARRKTLWFVWMQKFQIFNKMKTMTAVMASESHSDCITLFILSSIDGLIWKILLRLWIEKIHWWDNKMREESWKHGKIACGRMHQNHFSAIGNNDLQNGKLKNQIKQTMNPAVVNIFLANCCKIQNVNKFQQIILNWWND